MMPLAASVRILIFTGAAETLGRFDRRFDVPRALERHDQPVAPALVELAAA